MNKIISTMFKLSVFAVSMLIAYKLGNEAGISEGIKEGVRLYKADEKQLIE